MHVKGSFWIGGYRSTSCRKLDSLQKRRRRMVHRHAVSVLLLLSKMTFLITSKVAIMHSSVTVITTNHTRKMYNIKSRNIVTNTARWYTTHLPRRKSGNQPTKIRSERFASTGFGTCFTDGSSQETSRHKCYRLRCSHSRKGPKSRTTTFQLFSASS